MTASKEVTRPLLTCNSSLQLVVRLEENDAHQSARTLDTMPKLHQYDYIFAIGLLFAALDAYNIGANDGEYQVAVRGLGQS